MSTGTVRNPGQVVGSLVAIVFGVVFVVVNSGGLAAPWPVLVRIAGLAVAAVLLVALLAGRRRPAPADTDRAGGGDGPGGSTFFGYRRFWLIVAAEAVALFAGLYVINGVLGHPEVAVAWIAVVVGVHFFGLGWAFRLGRFHLLGAAMTALGVAGFVLDAAGAGAPVVSLVSGVLSGVALFAAAGYSLVR
ncbi:hypothetical protein Athai_65300 [Actinocatenispora thailandica]|uniref:Uncharacterized protein n=1 Tax=Actinocatenispora thailandica TaxID=227318 RepID=A0A7R7DW77_9ACTN|nr:hypothetical protein [Actinocatenispora thailandica]BCJ39027.1 hypothetical protein Athai_65300 [Actinocatenispora thailandica]